MDEAMVKRRIDQPAAGPDDFVGGHFSGCCPRLLATSLGSDVQRPLGDGHYLWTERLALYHLFITPVFYRIFVPPLPEAPRAPGVRRNSRNRLPDVSAAPEVIELLDFSTAAATRRISSASPTRRTASSHALCTSSRRRSCMDVAETPLIPGCADEGRKRLVEAMPEDRKALWRERLLTLQAYLHRKSMNCSKHNPTARSIRISSWKRS